MKNLITSMACIAILLAFVLQFTQNQVIYNHMVCVDQAVNGFKEVAKQRGCITEDNISNLKKKIAKGVGCEEGEVKVMGTKSPVKRGEIIEYTVKVPIEGLIGPSEFFGISQSENAMTYTIERYTTSEYVGR